MPKLLASLLTLFFCLLVLPKVTFAASSCTYASNAATITLTNDLLEETKPPSYTLNFELNDQAFWLLNNQEVFLETGGGLLGESALSPRVTVTSKNFSILIDSSIDKHQKFTQPLIEHEVFMHRVDNTSATPDPPLCVRNGLRYKIVPAIHSELTIEPHLDKNLLTAAIRTKGFGGFILRLVRMNNPLNSENLLQSILLSVDSTNQAVSGKKPCNIRGASGGQFIVFEQKYCYIEDEANQIWKMQFDIKTTFPTDSILELTTAGRPNPLVSANLNPYVNPNALQPETLRVQIVDANWNQVGEITNDTPHDVRIVWSPVVPDAEYKISPINLFTLNTQLTKRCRDEGGCSIPATIPPGVGAGEQTIVVEENILLPERKYGTAKILVKDTVVEKPRIESHTLANFISLGSTSSAAGIGCDPQTGQSQQNATGVQTAVGCVPTEPKALIEAFFRVAALAGGGITLLLMVFASFQMITSAGNPETLKKAQEQFSAAVIGLLFIIFAVLLLQIIGLDLLGIPGFK